MQANRQPKAIAGGILPRRSKRPSPRSSGDPSSPLRAKQADPAARLERLLQRDPQPQARTSARTSIPVPLQARNISPADGDTAVEGRSPAASREMQRDAGADRENTGEEEGVLQVEEVDNAFI